MIRKEREQIQRALRVNLTLLGEIAQLCADGRPIGPGTVALATAPATMLMDMIMPEGGNEAEERPQLPLATFSDIKHRSVEGEEGAEFVEVAIETGKVVGELIKAYPFAEDAWDFDNDLSRRYGGDGPMRLDLAASKAWILNTENKING